MRGWGILPDQVVSGVGALPGVFCSAYPKVHSLHSSYQDRFLLYNLYHLLNYLNLLEQTLNILRRYK